MRTIKIGGVPEHFNLAWYLTLKNGEYKAEGINLRWIDYYGGTGAMCKALREGDIDIAVILTEGIIKDIIAGNPSKIVQTFVQSPLIWGIHVAKNSSFKTVNELKGTKAAISRYGSGSHLMAYINAENNNWDLETDLNMIIHTIVRKLLLCTAVIMNSRQLHHQKSPENDCIHYMMNKSYSNYEMNLNKIMTVQRTFIEKTGTVKLELLKACQTVKFLSYCVHICQWHFSVL